MATRQSQQPSKSGLKSSDYNDIRKARDNIANALRKQRREGQLAKRRNLLDDTNFVDAHGAVMVLPPLSRQEIFEQLRQLPTLYQALVNGSSLTEVEGALRMFRRMLSVEQDPPLSDVVALQAHRRFAELLGSDSPVVQFEALWCLTNIASGSSEHTAAVVDTGCVPPLVQLLVTSRDDKVLDQAIWAIGNIAADGPAMRDYVLRQGIVEILVQLFQNGRLQGTLLENATWALTNFCRGKPRPNFQFVKPSVDMLGPLLFSDNSQVLTDALWALTYLIGGQEQRIQTVLETVSLTRLVELLWNESVYIQFASLRVLGYICMGNESQLQLVLNEPSFIPGLLALFGSRKMRIRKDVCWTIANIATGNQFQINKLVQGGEMLTPLVYQLEGGEYEVRKEAAWAVHNLTCNCENAVIYELVSRGVVPPMVALLSGGTPVEILEPVLNAMYNILRVGDEEGDNSFMPVFEAGEGDRALEKLCDHKVEIISQTAVEMLEKYFEERDDEVIDPDVPAVGSVDYFGTEPH